MLDFLCHMTKHILIGKTANPNSIVHRQESETKTLLQLQQRQHLPEEQR